MLDFSSIQWKQTRHAGISICYLRRDASTGDGTVLIKMQPGSMYPLHKHRGVEEVFILQGGYCDNEGEHRAGDYVLNPAGSAHQPVANEGSDCVMLAVAHRGIELL